MLTKDITERHILVQPNVVQESSIMYKLPIKEEQTDPVLSVLQHRGVTAKDPGLLYQGVTARAEVIRL